MLQTAVAQAAARPLSAKQNISIAILEWQWI
jgi:hypothetical protein